MRSGILCSIQVSIHYVCSLKKNIYVNLRWGTLINGTLRKIITKMEVSNETFHSGKCKEKKSFTPLGRLIVWVVVLKVRRQNTTKKSFGGSLAGYKKFSALLFSRKGQVCKSPLRGKTAPRRAAVSAHTWKATIPLFPPLKIFYWGTSKHLWN